MAGGKCHCLNYKAYFVAGALSESAVSCYLNEIKAFVLIGLTLFNYCQALCFKTPLLRTKFAENKA